MRNLLYLVIFLVYASAGFAIDDVTETSDSANIFAIAPSSELTTGRAHSCVIIGGAVKCWGANNVGQVGNNSLTNAVFPVAVQGLTSGVTAMAAAGDRTCTVVNGSAKCWGSGYGKVPVQISGLTAGVQAIVLGTVKTCVLVSGAVKCWTTTAPTPTTVSGLSSGVTAITAGRDFNCALTSAKAVKCWGTNTYGQLGNGTLTSSTAPVQVYGLTSGVLSIDAGDYHVCARLSSSVRCWGLNTRGQLGNNTFTNNSRPVTVSGLTSVLSINGGGNHTCAVIASNASLKCWGSNSNGQLGDRTTTNRRVPVQVYALTGGGQAVSAGSYHTCARINSTTRCWGYNSSGQLGNGFTSYSLTSVETASPISTIGEITTPGSYVLTQNLITSGNAALFIHDTSKVTLNCNGRTIRTSDITLELIKIDNVKVLTIVNCDSQDSFAASIRGSRITTATIQKNTLTGLEILSSSGIRFNQNKVSGYYTQRTTNNSLIDGNTFAAPSVGITSGMVISSGGTGNRIIGNTMDGHWSGNPDDFFKNGSDDGIVLENESNCEVSSNTITNNWDCSIESTGSLTNCTIANNKLSNSMVCAIGGWYWNSWKGNRVIGNTANNVSALFSIWRAYALRTADEMVYFRDNTFTNNVETGNTGNTTYIDMSLESAMLQGNGIPITAANMSVGNNHFGGNTFGGLWPILRPETAMVDDGGNVCTKSPFPTYPLACGRP